MKQCHWGNCRSSRFESEHGLWLHLIHKHRPVGALRCLWHGCSHTGPVTARHAKGHFPGALYYDCTMCPTVQIRSMRELIGHLRDCHAEYTHFRIRQAVTPMKKELRRLLN